MSNAHESSPGVLDQLAARVTRRGLARSGGLLATGALMRTVLPDPLSAQESALPQDLIDALITLETFMVTFYGAARGAGSKLGLSDDVNRFVRAAQCEEDAHYHYLEAAGAAPSATSFTIADTDLADQTTFLTALLHVESLQVGAYMAAARAFSTVQNSRFVELSYQIGVVEAQHQALVRLFLGERLPSNRAYAEWQFRHPNEAVAELAGLGYIGGKAKAVAYPGPVDRYCRGVTGLVPETTEDQPPPEAPVVASPIASPEAARG
jgi:hypothetical protein